MTATPTRTAPLRVLAGAAFLNASMILGGMGPVDAIASTAGKLFAAFYALYSGVVFLFVAGLMVAPVFHRILHHFHLERGGRE